MKRFKILIIILLYTAYAFSQAPGKFSFQAVVRDANNALVANQSVSLLVNILQGSTSGNAVYVESHVAITNPNGLLTVTIGDGSVSAGSFADIDWSSGLYFLKVDIDPGGGNDYVITTVQQLLSVPYALYATESGNGFSGDYNDLSNRPQIPQIPVEISTFVNDAHYITAAQLNTLLDSLYNTIDSLRNMIEELGNMNPLPPVQDSVLLPTVSTLAVTNVTGYTAQCGGIISNDGGSSITARGVCWGTAPNPTISGNHTTDGVGAGSFTSLLVGLQQGTTYYVRAFATNSVGTAYGYSQTFTTQNDGFPCDTAFVTDYDGNIYNTVQIGQQCWMKENMRTSHYADGTLVAYHTTGGSAENGFLYSWSGMMHGAQSSNTNPSGVQGVCPDGWHAPSEVEWTQLLDYVSGQTQFVCGNDVQKIAKALTAQSGWNTTSNACAPGNDLNANNATGFSVLPAGEYINNYSNYGSSTYIWTTTQSSSTTAWNQFFSYINARVVRDSNIKDAFYSVRCLQN